MRYRVPAASLLLAALLLAAGLGEARAEGLGRIGASAGTELLCGAFSRSASAGIEGGTTILRPRLSLAWGPASLNAVGRLRYGSEGESEADLDVLALRAAIGRPAEGEAGERRLELAIGRFAYSPGPSRLLGCLDYFSRLDFERLVEGSAAAGGIETSRLPDDLVQASLHLGPLRLAATLAPLSPDYRPTPASSPWLVVPGLRETASSLLGSYEYQLRSIVRSDAAGRSLDPAYSLEAGLEAESWRLSLNCFEGADRDPVRLLTAKPLDITDPGYFDLYMRDAPGRMRRVGLGGTLLEGPAVAWAEASAFDGKLLALGDPYSALAAEQGSMSASGVEYAFGASIELGPARISAEWRDAWYREDVSGATPPFLGRAAAARASLGLPWAGARLGALGLMDLDDSGWLLQLRAAAPIRGGAELAMDLLAFGGPGSSCLGRLRNEDRLRLSLILSL